MCQRDVAILLHARFQLTHHASWVVAGRDVKLGDPVFEAPNRGAGGQRISGEPDRVDQPVTKGFGGFGFSSSTTRPQIEVENCSNELPRSPELRAVPSVRFRNMWPWK